MLAGLVAVVTGASTGIGRAIALALGAAGADVALTFRSSEEEARVVAGEIEGMGRRTHVSRLELSSAPAIAAFATDVQRVFEHVDIWVNNAGADILTGSMAGRSDTDKLDTLLTVDLRGTVLASWEAVRVMRPRKQGERSAKGVILNMSWDHALVGMGGSNPEMFAAVKGGILSFSKSLARSVAPDVRVNILAPGWIETDFGSELAPERYREIAESTPLGRWGTPEDVARAAVFLASPNASFLTGQTLFVGGGVVM